jgi:hypothetical protein
MLWWYHLLVSSEICSISDMQKTRQVQTKPQSYYKRKSHCLVEAERNWVHRHSFCFFVSVSFVSIFPHSFFLSGIFYVSLSSSCFFFRFIPSSLIIILASQSDGTF